MKRVKIWADYNSPGVSEFDGKPVKLDETEISKETWDDLQQWVYEYEKIIPLSVEDRKKMIEQIENLDKIGLNLLSKIKSEWDKDSETGEDIDFYYYSEGFQKYL